MSNTHIVADLAAEERWRWPIATALSVLLHIVVIGIGALIGQLVAGQPSYGGCVAFFGLLLIGPFMVIRLT